MKRTFLSILVLTAVLITACGNGNTPVSTAVPVADETSSNTVTAEGTLLPARSAELAFAQGGVVKEILVQPGEQVAEGDVIARLIGIESVQAELAAAKLEHTLAQQSLDAIHRNALLTSSQTEQALLNAQKAYETEANGWNLGNTDDASDLELKLDDYVTIEKDHRAAQEKLDSLLNLDKDDHERVDAQEDFDKEKDSLAQAYTELLSAVSENDQTLDEKLTDLLTAIANLEVARETQSRLDDSNLDPEKLAAAEARLEAATAHVNAAEGAIELYELRASINGILLSLDLTVGEAVAPTHPIAFLANTSRWIVETKDLAEIDAGKVSIGDPAIIKLDAFPEEEFTGAVTKINPVGKLYLGDMTYQITITLDETDARFLWNMTATVTVNTADD